MTKLIGEHGLARLFLSFLLPFLLSPLLNLIMCRGALSMWDGYPPSARDVTLAFAGYFRALLFTFLYALVWFAVIMAIVFIATPGMLIFQLFGSAFGVATLIACVVTVALFSIFLWPIVRRLIVLQFFFYFNMADHPALSKIGESALNIFRELKKWSIHCNSMALYGFLIFFGAAIPVQFISHALSSLVPYFVTNVFSNFVLIVVFMWILTALAGFHRLCLFPLDDIPAPNLNGKPAP
jgi:hypothetical protein